VEITGRADLFAKITNEFKFNIASFHHAHEAYLVPDVLKKTLVYISHDVIFVTKGLFA
jgi:hypothetical protein